MLYNIARKIAIFPQQMLQWRNMLSLPYSQSYLDHPGTILFCCQNSNRNNLCALLCFMCSPVCPFAPYHCRSNSMWNLFDFVLFSCISCCSYKTVYFLSHFPIRLDACCATHWIQTNRTENAFGIKIVCECASIISKCRHWHRRTHKHRTRAVCNNFLQMPCC